MWSATRVWSTGWRRARPDEALATELQASALVSRPAATSGRRPGPSAGGVPVRVAEDRNARLLDAAATHLAAADTARITGPASCQTNMLARDALTGLLGVFACSPNTEARLLAAWKATIRHRAGNRSAAATSYDQLDGHIRRADQALGVGGPERWAHRAVAAGGRGRAAQAYGLAAAAAAVRLGRPQLLGPGSEVQMYELDVLIMRGHAQLYSDDLPGHPTSASPPPGCAPGCLRPTPGLACPI